MVVTSYDMTVTSQLQISSCIRTVGGKSKLPTKSPLDFAFLGPPSWTPGALGRAMPPLGQETLLLPLLLLLARDLVLLGATRSALYPPLLSSPPRALWAPLAVMAMAMAMATVRGQVGLPRTNSWRRMTWPYESSRNTSIISVDEKMKR